MVSKIALQQWRQLGDARAARQPRVKRPNLDIVTESDEQNSAIHENDLYHSDNKSYNQTWYWHNSSQETSLIQMKRKGII